MSLKINFLLSFLAIIPFFPAAFGQLDFNFEPSASHPFGLPNPNMPEANLDFAPLIGECECKSVSRINQNTWADTTMMSWTFKYIMNGMAVQDETLKADGKHSGSIRQYIADSSRWYVHYYSSTGPTAILPAWEGGKNEDGKIILYKDQTAPNGTPGNYKITFKDISENGFNWEGEWVNKTETFSYPSWKIFCTKKVLQDKSLAVEEITHVSQTFSRALERDDHLFIADCYTSDGIIAPTYGEYMSGQENLTEYWKRKSDRKVIKHFTESTEIQLFGDYAYDYGYWNITTKSPDEEAKSSRGKYLLIWKKVEGKWKIYLDIWNGL